MLCYIFLAMFKKNKIRKINYKIKEKLEKRNKDKKNKKYQSLL